MTFLFIIFIAISKRRQTHPKRIPNAWSTPLGLGMVDSGSPRQHRERWAGRAPPPECADAPAADHRCAVDASLGSSGRQSAASSDAGPIAPWVQGQKLRPSITDPSLKTHHKHVHRKLVSGIRDAITEAANGSDDAKARTTRPSSEGCLHDWGHAVRVAGMRGVLTKHIRCPE